MGDGDAEKNKKIVVEDFCEPLNKKQKEKCVEFYDGWAENEPGREESPEKDA